MNEEYDRRSLSVGDAIAVVALLAFILGYISLWVFAVEFDTGESEETDWFTAVFGLLCFFGPLFWAGGLAGKIIRRENNTARSENRVEAPQ